MRSFTRWLAAVLACVSTGALAQQAVFDAGTGVLTVPAVKVGAATYTNVLLGLINAANYSFTLRAATLQEPAGPADTVFNGGTGILSIPSVKVGASTYLNVALQITDAATYTFILTAATLQQPTYDAASAWRNLLTGTNSWALNGTGSDGKSYQLTFATKPGPTSVFPYTGASGARAEWTLAGKVNGVPDPVDVNYLFFNATTYGLFGLQNVTEGTCSSATAGPPLPTAALLGASGALHNQNYYVGCTPSSTLDGTSTATWSIESDNGNILFCSSEISRSNSGAIMSNNSFCFQTDSNGTLGTKARIVFSEPGFNVTFRN
jgi:hypothetical protein